MPKHLGEESRPFVTPFHHFAIVMISIVRHLLSPSASPRLLPLIPPLIGTNTLRLCGTLFSRFLTRKLSLLVGRQLLCASHSQVFATPNALSAPLFRLAQIGSEHMGPSILVCGVRMQLNPSTLTQTMHKKSQSITAFALNYRNAPHTRSNRYTTSAERWNEERERLHTKTPQLFRNLNIFRLIIGSY